MADFPVLGMWNPVAGFLSIGFGNGVACLDWASTTRCIIWLEELRAWCGKIIEGDEFFNIFGPGICL